tara:strand:+ start:13457 stop:14389 length:933 start_codon:yes stop_codon:yes gene_type:complete
VNDERRYEALLNEYKGSLFEYLVASSLAKNANLEKQFLESLSESTYSILAQQEGFIRHYKPDFITSLQNFAEHTALQMNDYLSGNIKQIQVIGKSMNAEKKNYSEVDLIVIADQEYHFSLKLSKANTYVNTKSMGIKSFLEKYFQSPKTQLEFNKYFDQEFEVFAREIHQFYDLDYDAKFIEWQKENLPVLPGQLNEGKELLYAFYGRINAKIYSHLSTLMNTDFDRFKNNLQPLCGFSDENLIQVICFHKEDQAVVHMHTNSQLNSLEIKQNTNNVELLTDEYILQLRLKPMNIFINPAYKINCAVKFI